MELNLFLRKVEVTRYILPLREGGSLPALTEASDGFKYVLKFKGAGHGVKALIAEFLGGEIARLLGFKVPELVFATLGEGFGQSEADEEIQDLLKFSTGLNLGLHYLSGAMTYDVAVNDCDELLASKIVWLDTFITNVDRTFKNTNMLIWHKELWLIDHGASFYFHHSWNNWEQAALTPFSLINDHALLPKAGKLDEVNEAFVSLLSPDKIKKITDALPDEWLVWEGNLQTPDEIREVYFKFLTTRLSNTDLFLNQAKDARKIFI